MEVGRGKALFTRAARERDGGAVFPVRRRVALVAKELTDVANLGDGVGAILLLPAMVTGSGKRLFLFGQDGIVDRHFELPL